MHMQKARTELFNPRLQTNIKSTARVVESGTVSINALLKEFHNGKKGSYKYFSVSKSHLLAVLPTTSQAGTTWIMAVNNVAESALGGCTRNAQTGNRIHLSSETAVSDAKRNHLFDRSI